MNKLFTQLLKKRQISNDFLHPKYEDQADPFLLPDLQKAIDRIKLAIKNQEKILIYGDYDVDGVTASTVMEDALRLSGLKNIEIMLPDRFVDGYGMSPRLIERAKKDQISLVITVDCGSRNGAIIDELNILGIDTIVTDHHECGETLPAAVAVVNPKRPDFTGPQDLKNLAGVGVAFKLATGLVKEKLIPEGQEKWLLDLVLIGTICDSMLLTGENRILCFYGVKVLGKTRRPGLQILMKNAGVTRISAESIGFQIGPRLNAAGRLETAELSLQLLRTHSAAEAAALAEKLEQLNAARRHEQRTATAEIAARLKDQKDLPPVIIETGPWHEGILGIVAGRLVEQYHRPAFVLAEVEGGIYKGSGRSFGDFSLAAALDFAKDVIIGGGGHAGAAGVRVDGKNLWVFREKITEYYNGLHLGDQSKFFVQSADLSTPDVGDISLELIEDLSTLEPFGAGNEEPLFLLTGAHILSAKRMGDRGQHLCLIIKGRDGATLKCVAFNAPDRWFNLYPEDEYDFLIQPLENEFRGTRSVEARLLDVIFA